MKTTIKEVPSGTIDVVHESGFTRMEFNCSCEDAFPICNAVCCRARPYYNVIVEEDEKHKYEHAVPHPHNPQLTILDHEDGHCKYLQTEGGCKCTIQETKPRQCKVWHCSPGGGGPGGTGEGITMRANGFALIPAVSEEAQRDLVKLDE